MLADGDAAIRRRCVGKLGARLVVSERRLLEIEGTQPLCQSRHGIAASVLRGHRHGRMKVARGTRRLVGRRVVVRLAAVCGLKAPVVVLTFVHSSHLTFFEFLKDLV